MKAIGYYEPQPISQPDSLLELDIAEPVPAEDDLLVEVKAVSVNPVDYKIRRSRKSSNNQPVILGWDAAGVVVEKGSKVKKFAVGDKVFYAGDLNRQGANAQLHLINHKLAAKIPSNLDFVEAAALPLTALTAYEALFEKLKITPEHTGNILIIGGAGGVGSIAIQLLKQLTQTRVYATYGRAPSLKWLQSLNVDGLLDRNLSLTEHFNNGTLPSLDAVFSTTHTGEYLEDFPEIIRPFGQLCLIDDPENFDIRIFKRKALSLHWEFMFAKSLFNFNMESQGEILQKVAKLVEAGKIRSTANVKLSGLNVSNFKQAHTMLESGEAIGKITIEF
jgi:NADPH:quinone reductase